MRDLLLLVPCLAVAACDPPDGPNYPVSLQPPYSDSASNGAQAQAKADIVPGQPVRLDRRQQDAVVTGITKWLKDPGTAYFGEMSAARNPLGYVTVCGDVDGRNSSGKFVGMAPFIGVLLGQPAKPEFVVVQIAAFGRARAEVVSLCRESGNDKG
jgi:hypothetical protein